MGINEQDTRSLEFSSYDIFRSAPGLHVGDAMEPQGNTQNPKP